MWSQHTYAQNARQTLRERKYWNGLAGMKKSDTPFLN